MTSCVELMVFGREKGIRVRSTRNLAKRESHTPPAEEHGAYTGILPVAFRCLFLGMICGLVYAEYS